MSNWVRKIKRSCTHHVSTCEPFQEKTQAGTVIASGQRCVCGSKRYYLAYEKKWSSWSLKGQPQ